ncbi:unnamed protein product, partial [Rotaria sp. Silwood2]
CVLAFSSGNQYGRYLFYYSSVSMYWCGHGGLTVDNSGNIYVATYNNISKWTASSSSLTPIMPEYFGYGPRMRLDSKGNFYTSASYSGYGVDKYNILSNTC